MKFEVLKKSHLKRNIMIGVTIVAVLSMGILTFTKAKYRSTQSIPLVNGTINYELSDLNLIGVYIQGDDGYTKSDTIPESGYELNEEESYCTVNGEEDTNIRVSYDMDTKLLTVTSMTTKGTKCYLYFDEKGITNIPELIASKTLATRTDFNTIVTEDTTGAIYYADTSKGRTYYFAGNPTDNWVRFGGFYWRIIRINEDGTLRLIYQGAGANTTGTKTQIQTSAFNSTNNNNMYAGYMYTRGSVHGLESSSTIKGILDQWYQNNLTVFSDKIDGNAGFCGDRIPSTREYTSNGQGGINIIKTYYAGYIRLITNKEPTFDCTNSSDLYTTSGNANGNNALTYPIGLITVDEVAYAGGKYQTSNQNYYLYTGQYYWTMSPSYFGTGSSASGNARIFLIDQSGQLAYIYAHNTYGIRPVINLKADIQFSEGSGTSENPFVVL